jgi:uncharacterized FlaG/YvyC family protein
MTRRSISATVEKLIGVIMASDADSVKASTTPLVRGVQAPTAATANPANGKFLPPGGSSTAVSATNPKPAKPADNSAKPPPDLQALVAQLNKHLQSSGRPNHYRLDSSSGHRVIQEINPDTSKVVSEIPASEFKALAQSLGISGLLLDAHA